MARFIWQYANNGVSDTQSDLLGGRISVYVMIKPEAAIISRRDRRIHLRPG